MTSGRLRFPHIPGDGRAPQIAQTCQEPAHVVSNLGRPQRAQVWLWRPEQWAGDDAAELASIHVNRGRSLADQGHHMNARKSSRPEAWLELSRTYVRGEPWPWDRA